MTLHSNLFAKECVEKNTFIKLENTQTKQPFYLVEYKSFHLNIIRNWRKKKAIWLLFRHSPEWRTKEKWSEKKIHCTNENSFFIDLFICCFFNFSNDQQRNTIHSNSEKWDEKWTVFFRNKYSHKSQSLNELRRIICEAFRKSCYEMFFLLFKKKRDGF